MKLSHPFTPNRRLIWLLAAAVVGAVLLASIRAGDMTRQVTRLEAREQDLRQQVKALRERQERLEAARADLGPWAEGLLTGDRYGSVLYQMELAEAKSGVRLKKLLPQVEDAGAGYQRITVAVTVEGSLLQVYRFVAAVESSPVLVRVSGLQFWAKVGSAEPGANIFLTFYGGP
jgi:Tfp pilus assembly protein PilO